MVSFANSYKFTPELFSVWLQLLDDIPHAVLWLVDDNPATTANLKAFIYRHRAQVQRIIFTPRAHYDEYKQRLKLADVFLDTYPYNCGSTTNNVVQAGLPMVTMHGKTMVSRMGLSILSAVGLAHYCVNSHEAYQQRVKEIAAMSDADRTALRARIRSSGQQVKLASNIEHLLAQLLQARQA